VVARVRVKGKHQGYIRVRVISGFPRAKGWVGLDIEVVDEG
jgi:hypothetical protein